MKKYIISFLLFLSLNACYRIPQREEIEYRSNLENALVNTFPKKVTVVLHPFNNLSPRDTNRAYLEQAIPDTIEAMLEPLRYTLAYIPFEGMPFYVSSELSNLFQSTISTNDDDDDDTNDNDTNNNGINDDEEEDDEEEDDDEDEDDEAVDPDASYFSYLTNYLLVVPTQETQYDAVTTTNTNYYRVTTNTAYEEGEQVTNFTSNEVLITKTNEILTNVVIVNKNLLTPTNMLLLLYEEFPELTNYLSFFPIEIRRATEEDAISFKDYKLKTDDPAQWRANQRKALLKVPDSTNEAPDLEISTEPTEPFEYFYHITGNFRTIQSASLTQPAIADIRMQIYPPESTGQAWWEQKYNTQPPSLSNILKLEARLTDLQSYKANSIRTPFEKPKVSPRLKDEFETVSTNFRDSRPNTPDKDLTIRKRPLNLRLRVPEQEIPTELTTWLKYFHATIVNRPYTVLQVNTTPPDTLVYLNGFYIGSTPLIYPTAPLGQQRLRFLKEGFNTEEILIDIIPKQTNRVTYSLSSLNNSGTISITASLPDAEVFINSLYKGKAPLIISNLSLETKYRIEILDPSANLSSNRNSVYKNITLTEKKSSVHFDAQFKSYETAYRTPAQKGLLAATYISWFATLGVLGASIYTQARAEELNGIISQYGTPATPAETATLNNYETQRNSFKVASQATLYSAIAGAILSTGIMGWYLYSKQIYLGMEVNPQNKEWFANFKLKF